jgi:hypothetical protein
MVRIMVGATYVLGPKPSTSELALRGAAARLRA